MTSTTTPQRRDPFTHHVKCWPVHFRDIITGRKRFEIRRDDRTPSYQPGDALELLEWDPEGDSVDGSPIGFTGRRALIFIGFVHRGLPLSEGWCAFDLVSVEDFQRISIVFQGGAE
jgi:hypothetical protein